MDGVSSVASIIAVVQLTGSIVSICGGYIQEVKDARDDIITLQRAVASLEVILQKLKEIIHEPRGIKLSTALLVSNINDCLSCLEALEEKIDLGRGKRMMKRLGIRALKWPLKREEVDRIIRSIEMYTSFFTFSLQVDQTVLLNRLDQNTDQINESLALDPLPVARGAEFDSYMDQHEDECLPGTRTELLCQIIQWARSPQSKCIFWLNGKAGTGKSTICRTVAKTLSEAKMLGASFFFKRGEGDRGNAMKLFPTIVRQLMIRIPNLKASVLEAVREEPDLTGKSLKEQFDKLLLRPLLSLDSADLKGEPTTIIIVIDALDECENEKEIYILLQLIPQLRASTAVQMRIFLTSRDETSIMLGFSGVGNHHEDFALHDIPETVTKHDISLFIKDRFSKIRDKRYVSSDWPGDETIEALVTMSVPLFISAATVCRFLEDPKWDIETRLTELLEDQANYATKMEKTYLPILIQLLKGQADDESELLLLQFKHIIGVILLLAVPLSVNSLSHLLHTKVGVISNLLNSFQSVLHIPGNQDLPVRTLHLSFRNFLIMSRTKFQVDEQQTHKTIFKYCLTAMRDGLKRNICDLSSYGTQRKNIDAQLIQQRLPPELQYSCRYWAYHLERRKALSSDSDIEDVLLFLQRYFLYWVEAMSLLGLTAEVVGIINLLQTIVPGNRNTIISDFLHDAKRFVLKNRQIAHEAPLQLYCSGLVFAPRAAIIRTRFRTDLPIWICRLPQVEENWSAELQALEGHSGRVRSVAFSPDCHLLASGSHDETVRLWDITTGAVQQILKGHSDWVRSVVFSHDGRLLASGSYDRTVRVWDTVTGTIQQTLEGHSGPVNTVAFIPKGPLALLASGSDDGTVRLWDTAAGVVQQIFEGHLGPVTSVIFSPDGRLLVSGSSDETVRLWNTSTGTMQTLKGHSDKVTSVALSPDNRLLASSSDDRIIQLWDIASGVVQQTLTGHTDLVNSVVFSPDGQLLASGSHDKKVQLWDIASGTIQQTLEHSSRVRSVAFSPDGWLLASGSHDETARLWDIGTEIVQQNFEGRHSGTVNSIMLSPDSQLLASGSYDTTVRLWDTATGVVQKTLEGHSGWVNSVAFSPDGRMLASGSGDKTILLWDIASGIIQHTLQGHLGWVNLVTFSPDCQLLASSSYDKTVRVWNTTTGALQQILKGHSGWIQSITFSPDGRLLASGSDDVTVRLWDTTTGVEKQTFEGHSDWVRSVAFSPDGRLLASGSHDKTARLWDIATGSLAQTWNVKGAVTDVGYSEDSSYLITNLGILDIQSRPPKNTSHSPRSDMNICIIVRGHWVTLNGERVLWLPPEFRPSVSAVKGSMLVLGHASGRISFIEFHIQQA